MDYETIVIPKGTVLFRGMHSTVTLTSDFAGIPDGENFCLGENYNVFFYPFPWISSTVEGYSYTTIYVTTRDLKLVNLILPSRFNRQNRETGTGGIVSCNKINIGCDEVGREYDPCVDYTKVSKDVSGMLAIAKADAASLEFSKVHFRKWANKYFTTYKDSRGLIGVPEFVLHPRIDKTPRTEKVTDFAPWYRANKSKFNYIYLHVMESTNEGLQGIMDDFMSEDGLDLGDEEPYHIKVNKKTGFFQIDEFSNNQSELISPDLAVKPTTDMVLKQKSLYKTMSDKYPKADTIPGVLTSYSVDNDFVSLDGKETMKWFSSFFDRPMTGVVLSEPLRKDTQRAVFHIGNKKYVFSLTPAGREIEKQAYINSDMSFFTDKLHLKGHPINSHMSAYELIDVKGKPTRSDKPATHINGLLQYYAQKKGLLGASRRKTQRKRRKHINI